MIRTLFKNYYLSYLKAIRLQFTKLGVVVIEMQKEGKIKNNVKATDDSFLHLRLTVYEPLFHRRALDSLMPTVSTFPCSGH